MTVTGHDHVTSRRKTDSKAPLSARAQVPHQALITDPTYVQIGVQRPYGGGDVRVGGTAGEDGLHLAREESAPSACVGSGAVPPEHRRKEEPEHANHATHTRPVAHSPE